MNTKSLRNWAIVSFIVSMAVLLIGGRLASKQVSPIPGKIVSEGRELSGRDTILRGQDVYQRYGLMDHGSVWGHGSLRGMDFSATTLHRIGEAMRDYYASPQGDPQVGAFERLEAAARGPIEVRVIGEMRANRYDAGADTLVLTPAQNYALAQVRAYWIEVFDKGEPHYGFLPGTVRNAEERADIADFFFWTGWVAGTQRPNASLTYTSNWPPDRSVGNTPSPEALLWSIGGILGLFIALGIFVYLVHRYEFFYGGTKSVDAANRLLSLPVTPSQRAAGKFFVVAGLLFLIQVMNGGLLAHYTVHPGKFFIQAIGDIYPYSLAKTWHLQLAVFWIAVAWIGTAIYLAPLIAGREMPHQRLLVNILFAAALLVVAGSMAGEVMGIKGMLGKAWFWFGHQGWEYLELGRLWQILLFGGLLFWVVIVYRGMAPALTDRSGDPDRRALLWFYTLSALAVVLFFGFGLMYGRHTHLTIADYWRWFVVHIWVESIFEFFGVAVIAMFLVTLGLVSARAALRASYLTAIITFLSGIIGTAHHYYWYGGPSFWLALGSVFSSMEPVPLILLVVRAWMEFKSIRAAGQDYPYRWPLYFLTASSVWNFIGAGVFGFVINLPIVNYYEHATYLTVNHGHSALFGTYGMLAVSLLLFSWRGLVRHQHWNDGILKTSFWGLNVGLALMAFTSLLPVGILQVWHSYADGFWFARSAAFYELPLVQMFGQWRLVPDLIIIVLGVLPLIAFLLLNVARLRSHGKE